LILINFENYLLFYRKYLFFILFIFFDIYNILINIKLKLGIGDWGLGIVDW